ncbi:TPA: histone family protein [Candidatus Bipolaricaulota bacterium]|nr:histone family protein [Candidatus Bipolaricaulota bacterium]
MVKEFPLFTLERLAKKIGAERVSKEALVELRNLLLEIATEIARDAIEICKHAKRVTIKKEDIILAAKRWRK